MGCNRLTEKEKEQKEKKQQPCNKSHKKSENGIKDRISEKKR